MDFQDVVRKRRMVRSFEPRDLPGDLLERVLANGLRGPSAGFSQGFEFLVLHGAQETGRFWRACDPERHWERAGWPGVYNASALILPLAHKQAYLDRYARPDKASAGMQAEEAWPVPYWHIDTGMATLLILLTAVDAGLGAVFFGPPRGAALHQEFGVPAAYQAIGVIALGYAAPDRRSGSLRRGHREQGEMVHRGGW